MTTSCMRWVANMHLTAIHDKVPQLQGMPVVIGVGFFQTIPDGRVELEVVCTLPLQVHVGTTHQLGAKLEALAA